MSFKLYELSEMYQNIWDLVGDDEVDLDSLEKALKSVEDNIEAKAENITKLIKGIDNDAAGIKAEETRLAARRKTLENKQANMKRYLESQLKEMGLDKVKTPLFTIAIQNNNPSVEITNEDIIPERFKNTVTITSIVKKDLLDALKAGEVIEGATIKQGQSLRIR